METLLRRCFDSPDQFLAAMLGLLGAYLVSMDQGMEFAGFCAWLGSNIGWLIFAIRINAIWLLIMNLGFTYTSVQGLVNFWP